MRASFMLARFVKRMALLSGGVGLFLAPLAAPAQAPAAAAGDMPSAAPPANAPAPRQEAPADPSAEKPSAAAASSTAAVSASKESAAPEAKQEATAAGDTAPAGASESAETSEPEPQAAPEVPADSSAPEALPAEATPASPPAQDGTSPALSEQVAEDDYEGATGGALVEEQPGPKNLSLGVALDVTFPLGSTKEFIGSASVQGLSLDLRYYAWGNIGIGAGVALDSLSKKLTDTVTWDNATISGTQVRELSYTPITLKGYYAWRDQEKFIPYVAAGLGAARAVRRLSVGVSSLVEASWHFAMVPEAGLQIPIGPTLLLTNVRLNYLPPSGGVAEQIFANFSLGLSIQ